MNVRTPRPARWLRSHALARAGAVALAALTSAAALPAISAASTNLLTNPGFENGTTGWVNVLGTSAVASYDATGAPTGAVSNRIGGGFQHLRGTSAGALVEQVVTTGPIPAGTYVKASGYFGGYGTNDTRLIVRYLNDANAQLGLDPLAFVTRVNRNGETVLVYREGTFAPPPGTTKLAAQIEFAHDCCDALLGAADNVSLELVTTPLVPAALPMNTELLVNRDFELGWAPGSPLTLVHAQGWEVTSGGFAVAAYSNANPTSIPSTNVSCLISGGLPGTSCNPGGAGNLLVHASGSVATLRQRLDVSGNAFDAAGTAALFVSAFLGGGATFEDVAQVDVRFRNEANVELTSGTIGPVSRAQRISQTVLLLREQAFDVPAGTRVIDVEVTLTDVSCCDGLRGLVDNVSARLVAPAAPVPAELGVNLIDNGDFESGSLAGSPLQLDNPRGWAGATAATVEVLGYGSTGDVPGTPLAINEGLGGLLLSDGSGNSAIEQTVDLRGHAARIAAGVLRVNVSCMLGGFGADLDDAVLKLYFQNLSGGQIGIENALGPVTPLDRQNVTTLKPRTADLLVPPGAARMRVLLQFNNNSCCNPSYATADSISVIAYDSTMAGFAFCAGDGSGTACPCVNPSAIGAIEGCRNSLGTGGKLRGTGVARLSSDSLVLTGTQMPSGPALYFQGSAPHAGGVGSVFGDGLRCAGGVNVRLGVVNNVAGASQYPATTPGAPSISVAGLVSSPGLRTYQIWYRNSAAFCTSSTFNLTNGWEVIWNW